MKKNKSVENVEITPSKKKLTQARLPFKLISEDASTPVVPPTRKRKLSADGTDTAIKIGKISKENDLVEDLVVISDEDSKDASKPDKEVKKVNPFVKLVDTAWKKKLQKAKPKKRKSKRNSSKKSDSVVETETEKADENDVEMMDIDPENQEDNGKTNENFERNSENDASEKKASEIIPNMKHQKTKKKILKMNLNLKKIKTSNRETKSNTIESSKNEKKSDHKIDKPNAETKSPKTPRKEKSTPAEKNKDENNSSETVNHTMPEPVTPKTPARKAKSNAKDKLNTSANSIKLNESVNSLTPPPSTPKDGSRSSSVTSSLNDSKTDSNTLNLTPKQRLEEKEERNRQRQEKEDAKKREREEKEEQKRKEREEKEKQREIEKNYKPCLSMFPELREEKEEQKKKEREEKEEQKRKEKDAREEEKRKKQEALELEKQEQEFKKKKAAEAFVNFFVPKQKEKDQPIAGLASQNNILSSFNIKADMRLAPLVRGKLTDKQKLDMDGLIKQQKISESHLYLKNLKKDGTKIGASGKTWPLTDKDVDDDVMIIAVREKLRPKLFSFHENKRPPYWGTWRKKSEVVKPRRPFGQEEATMDEDDVLSLTPETQKARLKNLEDEFESEMKKPTEKLKPRLYGLLWETEDGGKPEKCVDALWNYFGKLSMIMDDPTSLLQPPNEPQEPEKKKVKKKKIATDGEQPSPKSDKKKKAKPENKEAKKPKTEKLTEVKKNQPGINSFLTKLKSS
ncbi:hypothetical protein MSG28_012363 [Choristoneura fumiferana]|uniref:Uncharacterized protein n=1 Tax=Choristoneura fumiferana TaxID=7141 RepID=A0ACC0KDJ1_CHOFU|nr:hypothetical protein MSG28_012363 [Choristoneura fumiferana]